MGSLREECIILPVDSVEHTCVRESCHRGTVMDILNMLSIQCSSFSCGFT